MKSRRELNAGSWESIPGFRLIEKVFGFAAFTAMVAAAFLFLPFAGWAGGVVTNCTESNLRAAMAGGGVVTFASDGVITLAATITNAVDTKLDGTGHDVTVSASSIVRVFYVKTNSTFELVNLKIANGGSTNGAGIFNDGGTLNLSRVILAGNRAESISGAEGGGIFNLRGVVNATACSCSNNSAYQGPSQSPMDLKALGGAIRNENGVINLQDCQFMGNNAAGAPTILLYHGVDGFGGAIHNNGTLIAVRCSFIGNSARGSTAPNCCQPGPAGGSGAGGAIYNNGLLTLSASTIANNSAIGGIGGVGIAGCATGCGGAPHGGGPGSWGGSAYGGAMVSRGSANVVNSTFGWNACLGGAGGNGGGGGPGIYHGIPGTDGGNGGAGGSASGGGIDGTVYLTNCTLAFNSAFPGAGGVGGQGGSALPPTISGHPGSNGSGGSASGGGVTGGLCVSTLLATNLPANSSVVVGDLGHNLSSDGSCAFSAPGSLNNEDPKLGPLASNRGPTLTMALLAGSPAIDAGDAAAAPPTDQRGFPRAGLAADMGAFEYGSMLPTLSISRNGANELNILASGNSGQSCRLLTSTDLSNWAPIATSQFSEDGIVLFLDTFNPTAASRFYRLVMP